MSSPKTDVRWIFHGMFWVIFSLMFIAAYLYVGTAYRGLAVLPGALAMVLAVYATFTYANHTPTGTWRLHLTMLAGLFAGGGMGIAASDGEKDGYEQLSILAGMAAMCATIPELLLMGWKYQVRDASDDVANMETCAAIMVVPAAFCLLALASTLTTTNPLLFVFKVASAGSVVGLAIMFQIQLRILRREAAERQVSA